MSMSELEARIVALTTAYTPPHDFVLRLGSYMMAHSNSSAPRPVIDKVRELMTAFNQGWDALNEAARAANLWGRHADDTAEVKELGLRSAKAAIEAEAAKKRAEQAPEADQVSAWAEHSRLEAFADELDSQVWKAWEELDKPLEKEPADEEAARQALARAAPQLLSAGQALMQAFGMDRIKPVLEQKDESRWHEAVAMALANFRMEA